MEVGELNDYLVDHEPVDMSHFDDVIKGNSALVITDDIVGRYPRLTKQEICDITQRDFNKLSIRLNESLVKSYKEDMTNLHRNKKEWFVNGCTQRSIDEHMELLRWGKTEAEKSLTRVRKEQEYTY